VAAVVIGGISLAGGPRIGLGCGVRRNRAGARRQCHLLRWHPQHLAFEEQNFVMPGFLSLLVSRGW
jgi:hypothetical protein